MKILCICEPQSYDRPDSDIPIFYHHLARDRRSQFFHLPVVQVLEKPLQSNPTLAVTPLQGDLTYEGFLELNRSALTIHELAHFNLIFCRTLKPFPAGYLTQLSHWEATRPFVNRPSAKIEQIQPDFLLKVAQPYIPETLVTNEVEQALGFFEQHGTVVAKRANSCGGRGVFKIWYQDHQFQLDNRYWGQRTYDQFPQLMADLQTEPTELLQFMRFLPRVNEGDKRVIVVDGEIYGAFIRRSKSGNWVNNISGDGACSLAEIGRAEREAIAHTIGHYRDRQLRTLGYDFLQDETGVWRISEINVGNIGGFSRLEALTQQPIMERFVSWLIEFARSQQG